jgi:hypothetical protein
MVYKMDKLLGHAVHKRKMDTKGKCNMSCLRGVSRSSDESYASRHYKYFVSLHLKLRTDNKKKRGAHALHLNENNCSGAFINDHWARRRVT